MSRKRLMLMFRMNELTNLFFTGILCLLTFSEVSGQRVDKEKFDVLIQNACVFDGTGQDSVFVDVEVRGDRIVFVGEPGNTYRADRAINGEGFPLLEAAEHTMVWQPVTLQEGAYNHYACLTHFKGKFYTMLGNHELGKDAPRQRVLYSTSDTWGNWTAPQELFPAPGPGLPRSESSIHLKPDRWAIVDDELYAITYVYDAGSYLPIGKKLYNWYRENNQISWGVLAPWGLQRTAVDGQRLIEPFIYRATDGNLVLVLRAWGTPKQPTHNNRIYASLDNGTGGWATPYTRDIPDSPSRTEAVTLQDGTILLIGNQNVNRYDQALYLDRDPITISISKDGYAFDKVYALRTGSPTTFRFSSVGERNRGYAYASSLVVNGWIHPVLHWQGGYGNQPGTAISYKPLSSQF